MTKKAFMEPECEIVRFDVEDILTTSSGEDSWLIDDFEIEDVE